MFSIFGSDITIANSSSVIVIETFINQPGITCLKLAIEILVQDVKYVQR